MSAASRIAIGVLAAAATQSTFAQAASLDDQQKLGLQLFYQHCGVCHTKPDMVGHQFGPTLSSDTFEHANESAIKTIIAVGTPDMPGFGVMLKPMQIDAIVDYLKQAPPPPATAK